MEEDVLGTRREIVGDLYSQCTRCGNVIPVEESTLVLVDAGPHAGEQVELCAECRRELESGEAAWEPGDVDEIA